MWQYANGSNRTFIKGWIDFKKAINTETGYLVGSVELSRRTCNVTKHLKTDDGEMHEEMPEPNEHTLAINMNSTKLRAYKRSEMRLNLIFVDETTTASLISVHQGQVTEIMPKSTVGSWNCILHGNSRDENMLTTTTVGTSEPEIIMNTTSYVYAYIN